MVASKFLKISMRKELGYEEWGTRRMLIKKRWGN